MKWKERWDIDSQWIVAAIALVILSTIFLLLGVSHENGLDRREKAFEKRLIEGITTAMTESRQ